LGKNGGKFTIGGYDDKLKIHPDLPIEWIPLTQTSKYMIKIESISVGDKNLSNSPSTAMVDSGTTFS